MSTATATQEPKKFAKITVTITLETAEELKAFREMVGRDCTLPAWLLEERSVNVSEGKALSGILDNMYQSVNKF